MRTAVRTTVRRHGGERSARLERVPHLQALRLERVPHLQALGFCLLHLVNLAAGDLVLTHAVGTVPAGAAFPSAPFAFSRAAQTASGALVRIEALRDWDYSRGCPPTYVGEASLRGALVLHDGPSMACSYEQHARAAEALGAAAWLRCESSWFVFGPTPGFDARAWRVGDARALARPPAADVTSARFAPLLAALRRGEPAHATLTPSPPTRWDAQHASVAHRLLWAALALCALADFELAATRLHAFVREAGGPRLDAVQSMLVLELAIAPCRALHFLVDPVWSTGALPLVGSFALVSYPNALASLASLVFYAYFARAAHVAGVKQLGGAASGGDRALIVAAALGTHAVEACSMALLSVACGMWARMFTMCATAILYALAAVFLSARAHALATESLLHLPNGVFSRLTAKLSASMRMLTVRLAVGVWVPIAYPLPALRAPIWAAYHAAGLVESWVRIGAFTPAAVVPVRGPLQRALERARLALARASPFGGEDVSDEALWNAYSSTKHIELHDGLRELRRRRRHRARPVELLLGASVRQMATGEEMAGYLLLGLSTAALRALADELQLGPTDPTVLVGQALRARTASQRLSYAELLVADARARPSGAPRAVGAATLFVSHAQAQPFRALIAAIEAHFDSYGLDARDEFVWLDICSIRQHVVAEDVAHIGFVEGEIGSVLLVLDPWDAPVALTRVWCLFEIARAQMPSSLISLALAMPPSERVKMVRAAQQDPRAIHLATRAIDARNACSTVATDREMIFKFIADTFDADDDALMPSAAAATSEHVDRAFDRFNALVHAALESAINVLTLHL